MFLQSIHSLKIGEIYSAFQISRGYFHSPSNFYHERHTLFHSFKLFMMKGIHCYFELIIQIYFVTIPMVTGDDDEGTILDMVIESSPPLYHYHL